MSRLRPVTGGRGGELRIVGKAVIGGAMTGVTGPDEIGKTGTGCPVTGLAHADDNGDPPGAGLVPQAARTTAARLAVIITVQTCARVVRRMLLRRPGGHSGFRPRLARSGRESSWRICQSVERVSRASRADYTKMTQPARERNAILGRPKRPGASAPDWTI